jgi:Ca2+-binding EF-hand superfamily protein
MASQQDQNEIELKDKIQRLLLRKFGNTSRESMLKMFNEYDKNKNGNIDKGELEQLLKDADVGNGLTRGAWASGIIKKMDTGSDKSISWKEFDTVINSSN